MFGRKKKQKEEKGSKVAAQKIYLAEIKFTDEPLRAVIGQSDIEQMCRQLDYIYNTFNMRKEDLGRLLFLFELSDTLAKLSQREAGIEEIKREALRR